MKNQVHPLLVSLLVAGTMGIAQATPIIHEGFTQSVGGLDGATVGTGLTGTWSSASGASITSPTLTYGDLPNSGNQVSGGNVAGAGDRGHVSISSDLGNAGLLDDGATLWFSLMTTGASGSNQHSGFTLETNPVLGNFNGMTMAAGSDAIGLYFRQGSVRTLSFAGGTRTQAGSGLSAPAGQSNFIVGRIDWGATAGDVETITIYTPDTNGLALPGTSSVGTTAAGFDQTALNVVSFASRAGVQNWDEIRFGASYEDVIGASVIPEASTIALLGVGGLLLLLRRYR